jgi:hypothetical protein
MPEKSFGHNSLENEQAFGLVCGQVIGCDYGEDGGRGGLTPAASHQLFAPSPPAPLPVTVEGKKKKAI